MRGQLESPFQWIFVLAAGAAFLALFFFLIKGCTESGQSRAQGLGVALAASRLHAGAWQGTTVANTTVQAATVSCTGDSLVLRTERQSASIDRAPVFLPPALDGRLQVLTETVALEERDAHIRLGNVLYGIDERTYYLVVQDPAGRHRLMDRFRGRTLKEISAQQATDPHALAASMPESASTAIIVVSGGIDPGRIGVGGIPADIDVRAVMVAEDAITFYTRKDGKLVATGQAAYAGDALAAGAAISGDPQLYACGRDGFATRLQHVTRVYQLRAASLKTSSDPVCGRMLAEAEAVLRGINEQSGDAYLDALSRETRRLTSLQSSLRATSCPVIA